MNAEQITAQIMAEILGGSDTLSGDQFVLINRGHADRIRYAISRAVGSIISGLSPCDHDSGPNNTDRPTEWAYQQVCRALEDHKALVADLRSELNRATIRSAEPNAVTD